MTISFANQMANPEEYLPPAPQAHAATDKHPVDRTRTDLSTREDFQERVDQVMLYLAARGFVFEPWQVAAFITAVRTKPFVILAGISGTGKTKLTQLIAEATGAECLITPVRPDWTDSSELLGFERLNGTFQPGALLRFARHAQEQLEKQFFFLLDEMNIARVEYYLAEVLSRLEDRRPTGHGQIISEPLLPHVGDSEDGQQWQDVRLPGNLCIVGTVNMDETTYGFSKKVLDRAFVIEFSTVDLSAIGESTPNSVSPQLWSSHDWRPTAISLAAHPEHNISDVQQILETLTSVNSVLEHGQLQFGYRVRDEIVMFCLAARQCAESFTTASVGTVAPLDLAIAMKVLPRIQGSGATIRRVLEGLQTWAAPNTPETVDEPGTGANTGYPFCAARLELMLRRLRESGFTNFWL